MEVLFIAAMLLLLISTDFCLSSTFSIEIEAKKPSAFMKARCLLK